MPGDTALLHDHNSHTGWARLNRNAQNCPFCVNTALVRILLINIRSQFRLNFNLQYEKILSLPTALRKQSGEGYVHRSSSWSEGGDLPGQRGVFLVRRGGSAWSEWGGLPGQRYADPLWPTRNTVNTAVSMHPTGMHSCLDMFLNLSFEVVVASI